MDNKYTLFISHCIVSLWSRFYFQTKVHSVIKIEIADKSVIHLANGAVCGFTCLFRALYLLLLQGAMVRAIFLHVGFYALHNSQKLKVSHFRLRLAFTDFLQIAAQFGTLYL